MELIKGNKAAAVARFKPLHAEPDDTDEARFFEIIATELNEEQKQRIINPSQSYPRQESVLAIHWHPEFVPQDMIDRRLDLLYPNRREELIIPTQHNQILARGPFCGVEVDCYSRGFKRKVQLLLHFSSQALERSGTLAAALEHTFQYRSSQLLDLVHTLSKPVQERLVTAAGRTGALQETIDLVRMESTKLERLIDRHYALIPREAMKNKMLRNYLDTLRPQLGDESIEKAQNFLRAVKMEVKAGFPITYFYRTSEIIEEARTLGAGIVIPHPEQFWPILLAEYDVDGYEVWNPQSLEYTDFLISVVINKNKGNAAGGRRLLIFMGDDTHMGEKVKSHNERDQEKAAREIGLQPPWDDPAIRKKLAIADMDRHKVIEEYRARLLG